MKTPQLNSLIASIEAARVGVVPRFNGLGTALYSRLAALAVGEVVPVAYFGHGTRGNRLPTLFEAGVIEWHVHGVSVIRIR